MKPKERNAAIDRLYQLPLDEFTAARNALAKSAGPDSVDIRKLSKPPLAAWAVNQLYWQRPDVYEALVGAATDLRTAHAAVLAGRRADLRTAGKAHEGAIETALKATLGILQASGHPATEQTRHAIATTLRTLPADDPPGRLTGVLQPSGFEALAGMPVRAAPAVKKSDKAGPSVKSAKPRGEEDADVKTKADKPAANAKAIARARDALATATRAFRTAEHTARREEFEAARAVREAEKAARAVTSAQEALEAARQAVADAETDAAKADRARQAAERRARDAEAALEAARASVASAQRELDELG